MFHFKKGQIKRKQDEGSDEDVAADDDDDDDINIQTHYKYSNSGSSAWRPLLAANVEFQKAYGSELFWIDW